MLVPFYDDGSVATGQSLAILEYLEEAHPEVPLLPCISVQKDSVKDTLLALLTEVLQELDTA